MNHFYREHILDHYRHPRNFKSLAKKTVSVSDNLVSCGDTIKIELLIDPKLNQVADIGFTGNGCVISMAAASMLTEFVKGKKITELKRLNRDDILKLLNIELTASRIKCALLSLEVLHKGVNLWLSTRSK